MGKRILGFTALAKRARSSGEASDPGISPRWPRSAEWPLVMDNDFLALMLFPPCKIMVRRE